MTLNFKEIIKHIKIIPVTEYHEKIWVKKPGFFESKSAGCWVGGLYYPLDNKITIFSDATNEEKISVLIHELVHAAHYYGFDKKSRKMFLYDKIWWRNKNILIEDCREEMIAYIGQYILSEQLGLDEKYLNTANKMFFEYRNKLENLKGSEVSDEELIMLKTMAEKRLEKVNQHYYNFIA